MERECKTCVYFSQIANEEPCKDCYTKDGLPNWQNKLQIKHLER